MKNISKVIGIVLYVLASFLLIYTIWSLTHNISYIGDLISSGQLEFAGNEYDIISFYMTNSGQFAMFAVILFAQGWMIAWNPNRSTVTSTPLVAKMENGDEELDEWFVEPT